MGHMNTLKHSLIDMNDCILVIVDVQDSFLAKNPPEDRERIINRVGWLMDVARILQVPMVITAEEIERMGSVSPCLAEKLPPGTPVYNKMVFALMDNSEIKAAVDHTGRKTAVLVGLETDVCIAQSALSLLKNDYQVVVLADATASPCGAHEVGLERMRGAGVLVTSLKSLYYEWIRTVELNNRIYREYGGKLGELKGIDL
jgi:nicotinamidase-related amidase